MADWLNKKAPQHPNEEGVSTEKSIPNTDAAWRDCDPKQSTGTAISVPINEYSLAVVQVIMKQTQLSQRKVLAMLVQRAAKEIAEGIEAGEPVYKFM